MMEGGVTKPISAPLKRVEIDLTLCRSLVRARILEHFGADAWIDIDEVDAVLAAADGSAVQVFSGVGANEVGEIVHRPEARLTVARARVELARVARMRAELEDGDWCVQDAEEAEFDLARRALAAIAEGSDEAQALADVVLSAI